MKARTSYLHTLKASDIIPRGVEKFAQPVAATARRTIRGRIMREARLKSIENDGRSCSIDRWKIGRFKSKIKMEGERYLTSRLSVEEKRTWFFSVDSSNTANFISHLGRILFFFFFGEIRARFVFLEFDWLLSQETSISNIRFGGRGRGREIRVYESRSRKHSAFYRIQSRSFGRDRSCFHERKFSTIYSGTVDQSYLEYWICFSGMKELDSPLPLRLIVTIDGVYNGMCI